MIYDWEKEGDFPPAVDLSQVRDRVREVYFTADDFDHVIVLDAREPEVAEEYRRMGIVWDGAGIFQVDLGAYLADRVRTRNGHAHDHDHDSLLDPDPGFAPLPPEDDPPEDEQ